MPWPTWQQSAIAAIFFAVLIVVFRRARPTILTTSLGQAATEMTIISGLYSVWRMARKLPLVQADGALDRGRSIAEWQDSFFLPSELTVQEFLINNDWLGRLASLYYIGLHVPALWVFLVWLFIRQRHAFSRWRNVLAILTAFCLFIRFVRVAPPRFLAELGFIDLPAAYGLSPYGVVGTGVSQQFAAMPSIHVAWAAIVSIGVVTASTSKWRWLALLHLVITVVIVAGTGHHWWADGLIIAPLLIASLAIDTYRRRLLARLVERYRPATDPLLSGTATTSCHPWSA
ncbi:MAG: phosphatase PAP2 family protein [Acidimicrobiales bacterium]|jgi:hypothetical protein